MKRSSFIILPTLAAAALVNPIFAAPPVDFEKDVKPILEGACLHCHAEDAKEDGGDYYMNTKELAFKGGPSYGKDVINTKDPQDSP
ncbi:MAG: hypothetical protein HKN23_02960, partial [Verrucomicrobiales bacterium]|nr:hypothetical protein [Verrucomicrobiales bacterium]